MDSRYRITGVLGSGGMGCVYLAEHVSIKRPLALKLLHPEVGEVDEVTKRFEREAFAIGRVDHPNCVNVSDFGKLSDGTFYMVLELLDGVLLSDLLERDVRLGWKRVLHIGRHILSALDYAHGAGIIHRDVKPENVILVEHDDDPDFAKILDFGIAKLLDDGANHDDDTSPLGHDAKLTQVGVTVGTPTYIAPEQAYAQSIDGRADLYSLSVMMYEMITGVPPFDSDDVGSLLRMHVSTPVPRFEEAAPDLDVPDTVEALIRHGLEKKACDRIGSAAAYIESLDEVLREVGPGQSGLRAVPSIVVDGFRDTLTSSRVREGGKKKPVKRIVAGALLVLALISFTAFAFGRKGPNYLPNGSLLPIGPAAYGPEAETAAAMLSQGRPQAAVSYLTGHRQEVREAPYAQMVLGHAQASAQRSILALAAYAQAVTLQPKLARDKLMRTNLALMLDKKAPGIVDDAIELLGVLASVGDDGRAADQLIDLASSSKDARRRHKAMAVADEVGLGDQVDRFGSYLLDLEQGQDCAARKEAVAKLRTLGNKKAIPALRSARKRIRTEGGFIKRQVNTNACLRTDAAEAIRYLKKL
ncbi:MAG: protein kinase [Deltaproteobacteria bacterium]|nr:protein kinase [Deltaproteobacteria bacterium]